MKEQEREREKTTEGIKLFEDTTANERYYARSIKIRMATQELLMKMADLFDLDKPVPYDTLESLGIDCANWVKKGRWDDKAGSTEAGVRWAKQYLSRLGPFKPVAYSTGFCITWRDRFSRDEVIAELARFRRK